MGTDKLKENSIASLLYAKNILGKNFSERACPYRSNCSLYKTKDGTTALAKGVKKKMCDHDGQGHPPRIGWIYDTDSGTVCEAYLGRKTLEAITILSEKVGKAKNVDKYNLGGL